MSETLLHTRSAPTRFQREPDLTQWLEDWTALRAAVESLAQETAQVKPAFDAHSVDWLLDELDSSLRLLRHRVEWLKECAACGR
ncbi:MAG: hypothetical protein MUD01_24920 [Chloroflexaceae bacterium]|nr:hypothetical protein [Chloroflexaceae bacterium]